MPEKRHFIPIWFFIGLLLGVYGVMILGSGIYELISPPAAEAQGEIARNVMGNLHAAIWWGALLLALGAAYTGKFWPGKDQVKSQRSKVKSQK